jgi:predicted membrane chloride channel (bestrophin family)
LSIPAQVIPVLGRWSVPLAVLAAWVFLGVEAVSAELGHVFGMGGESIVTICGDFDC